MDACRKIIKIWIHAEYHTRPEMQVEDFANPTRISSRAWVALHLRTESIKSSLRQLETRPDLPSWGSRECRAQQRCTRCRPPGTPPPLHTPPGGPRIRHRPAHKRTTNACVHASFTNIQTTRVYTLRAVQSDSRIYTADIPPRNRHKNDKIRDSFILKFLNTFKIRFSWLKST